MIEAAPKEQVSLRRMRLGDTSWIELTSRGIEQDTMYERSDHDGSLPGSPVDDHVNVRWSS
jgi:hypothetical protein